jgi:hypothetical protein
VALYLAADLRLRGPAVFTAPLLFFVFIGLSLREPGRYGTLTGALLALLVVVFVFALVRSRPYVAEVAIAFSSIAVMTMYREPGALMIASHAILFTAILTLAWITGRHFLALLALPFSVAAHVVSAPYFDPEKFVFGAVIYALFLLYPLVLGARVKQSVAPHVAAIVASGMFFVHTYALREALGFEAYAGFLPLAQAVLLLVLFVQLLRFEPHPLRLTLVGAAVLGFLTIAVPVQLDRVGTMIGWSIMAVALAWLFTRLPHIEIALWSIGLGFIVLGMLAVDPSFGGFAVTYAICAAAMFVAAWLTPPVRIVAASLATLELFMLLNVAIGDYYSGAAASTLARDLTYTIAWALFAIAMLVAGIALGSRAARVAALGLLLVTVLKCFLYDLAQLGGLYRVASLFGLAVSLVLVGVMLQKFVMMKRAAAEPTS